MQTLKLMQLELKKRQVTILLTLVAIALLFLRTFSLLPKFPNKEQSLVLPAVVLIVPLVLWTLWNHWQSLSEDWQLRTTHLLFSFPLKGWQVLAAKGGSALLSFLLFTLTSAFLGGVLTLKVFPTTIGEFTQTELYQLLFSDGGKLYLQYFLFTAALIGFSQLVFVLGRLVPKLQGLVSAGGAVVVGYLLVKILSLLQPLIRMLPLTALLFNNVSFNPWYMVLFFLLGLVAMLIAGWLLDEKVDF